MKKQLQLKNLRALVTAFVLLLFSVNGFSQACPTNQITLSIRNVVANPAGTTLEYDIYMTNTGPTALKVSAYAGNVRLPLGMMTAGTLEVVDHPVATGNWPGMSNLSNVTLVPPSATQGQARWTNTPLLPESTSVNLPSNVDTKWARFRINNTGAPWTLNQPSQLTFNTSSSGGASLNTITVYCSGNPNSTPVTLSAGTLVLQNPPPIILAPGAVDTCFTSGTYTETPATCSTSTNGAALFTMNPVPSNLNATVVLDSNPSAAVTLSATGGFGLSGLTPGAHTVVVTGSGTCTTAVTINFTITAGADIIPTFTQVPAICTGGTLNPLPTTSNNSITGSWSPALDNTTTTLYTFTPDAGQCATTATMTITVNSTLVTPTFTQVGPICSGASLAALPTTSTNGINGTWSPALSNTATDTYTFTPTSGQCADTTTMTITVNQNEIPTFNAIAAICQGSVAPALPSSSTNATPITGTWNPATINTATAGTVVYTFTPTAGLCATTTSMSITVNPTVTPTFNAIAALCQGNTAPTLATSSTNATPITGAWNPATISTAAAGTTIYAFTPDAGQCAVSTTMSITVSPNVTPTFNAIAPLCQGSTAPALPTTTTNATPIAGTWNPATISTATAGTTVYTFTPNAGLCAVTTTMSITVSPTVTPTFNAIAALCQGSVAPALPTTSTNATPIAGTWNPATINTATAGTVVYTFTPDAGICATTANLSVTVNATTNTTTNINACDSYTWPATGLTYNASGIYTAPASLPSGITNNAAAWTAIATSTNATVATNPLTGITAATPLVVPVGAITASITPGAGGMYSSGTFISTGNSNTPITITFSAPVYGVSGNAFVTNVFDAPIAGNITINYSDGTTDSQAVSSLTDFFGFYKSSGITSVVITPVIVPAVTRYVAIDNLTVATNPTIPACQTQTLNLTINNSTTGNTTATACGSYTWATPLGNGQTYTTSQIITNVTTNASGCPHTQTLNLTITPVTTNGSVNTTACGSYTWAANGVTYTTSQSGISFTSGCNTATLNVTINPLPATPTGNATQTFSVDSLNDATIASLAVSPAAAIWYPTEADALAGTNALASTTVLTNGATYWAVNAGTPCSSLPFAVTVTVVLGQDEFDDLHFNFYPNPTSSVLNISYSKTLSDIQVSNMLGQLVMTKRTNEMAVQIDLSPLAEATYFVKVTSEGKEKIIRIIKKN